MKQCSCPTADPSALSAAASICAEVPANGAVYEQLKNTRRGVFKLIFTPSSFVQGLQSDSLYLQSLFGFVRMRSPALTFSSAYTRFSFCHMCFASYFIIL